LRGARAGERQTHAHRSQQPPSSPQSHLKKTCLIDRGVWRRARCRRPPPFQSSPSLASHHRPCIASQFPAGKSARAVQAPPRRPRATY
jgi:hypothetical protein